MLTRLDSFRGLHRRDFAVVVALPFAVGLPFVWVQWYWFGPSDRLLSLLTSQFHLNTDPLTVAMSAIYLLLFSFMLIAGYCFLRHFLAPLHKRAE